MKNQKTIFPKIITFILVITIGACSISFHDSKADNSFLTSVPCAPPCWYGLIPGEATKTDVLETLTELPFVDNASVREYNTVWNLDNSAQSIRFGCVHPKEEGCGAALISDEQLKELWLTVNFPLDVETVINKLGLPTYIDYGVLHPEVGGCFVFLIWPDNGIGANYSDAKSEWLCQAIQAKHGLPRNIKITEIVYAVKDNFGQPGGCCRRIEWPGFETP